VQRVAIVWLSRWRMMFGLPSSTMAPPWRLWTAFSSQKGVVSKSAQVRDRPTWNWKSDRVIQ